MELYLSAYQCYRMRQYQTPRKLIEEIDSLEEPPPYCPPAKLLMRVQKMTQSEKKTENKEVEGPKNAGNIFDPKPGQTISTQANLKLKISPQSVLHLVPHNSPLKGKITLQPLLSIYKFLCSGHTSSEYNSGW